MDNIERDDDEQPPDRVGIRADWVVVAEERNRTVAEFAVNGLRSYDIPAVLDSRPGFLGIAGLPLRSIRTGKLDMFRIMVPPDFADEAREVVKIFLRADEDEITEMDDDEKEEEEL
jgi:hypothetical protein